MIFDVEPSFNNLVELLPGQMEVMIEAVRYNDEVTLGEVVSIDLGDYQATIFVNRRLQV